MGWIPFDKLPGGTKASLESAYINMAATRARSTYMGGFMLLQLPTQFASWFFDRDITFILKNIRSADALHSHLLDHQTSLDQSGGEDDLAASLHHQYTSTLNVLSLRKVRVVCSVAGMRWPLRLSAVRQALHGWSALCTMFCCNG